MNIWCIHGNLQLPTVWDCFEGTFYDSIGLEKKPLAIQKESLWDLQMYSFDSWVQSFTEKIVTYGSEEKPWIMGYSLGARLALHAVLEQPELWKGAIIVAAHPGLTDPKERLSQLSWDIKWAGRFLAEPWNELLSEWDQLSVFCGFASSIKREENEYPRERIASMLTGFSKAKHAHIADQLARINSPPILYVSGEYDKKYTKFGAALAEQFPAITHKVIPGACHRVPWENTADFVKTIQYYIDSVSK